MLKFIKSNPFLSGLMILANLLLVTLTILLVDAIVSYASAAEDAKARGVVKALTEATIAMDYAARIDKLPVLEGQAFKVGQLLIAFDCRRYQSEVAAARAAAHAAGLVYSNNKKLADRGAMGSNEVEISMAQLVKAKAEADALAARTGSCSFKAPFDGRMVQRIAQEHESPAPNQPLIKIVDTSKLEIETIVPSKWLNWMKLGATFQFSIDETGQTVSAKIVRVGAMVDAVSQTIKAFGVLVGDNNSVLPGMSGTATFNPAGS
ncbi:MAG: efflux RND transporter periplasmic adaptor subunit [Alphaproteobacteria bacterium]|nr:efflux RND transporter periplasmic adaptor subunit [Alphaproteobacteria bacterium]